MNFLSLVIPPKPTRFFVASMNVVLCLKLINIVYLFVLISLLNEITDPLITVPNCLLNNDKSKSSFIYSVTI